jgi:hypothetical protein
LAERILYKERFGYDGRNGNEIRIDVRKGYTQKYCIV